MFHLDLENINSPPPPWTPPRTTIMNAIFYEPRGRKIVKKQSIVDHAPRRQGRVGGGGVPYKYATLFAFVSCGEMLGSIVFLA